jgi:hypothetical protein
MAAVAAVVAPQLVAYLPLSEVAVKVCRVRLRRHEDD